MSDWPDHTSVLGHGVFAVDTGFQRENFDAAYLLVDGGEAAFIDTGTNFAVPRLLEALAATGLTPEQVRWVIPTHVHLDHAGGVGALMAALPNAQALVHPRGARHMVDPTALWEGALAVYGLEEMSRSYGQLVAVPAHRVVTSHDGLQIAVGQRLLTLIDTPGHAKHHHCIWDPVSRGWFTGDTFGLSYRELDVEGRAWILPTSTPIQFEPDRLRESVARLLATRPECVYLTHFGRLGGVADLARMQLGLLDAVEALGLSLRQSPQRDRLLREGLLAVYLRSLRVHGSTLSDSEVAHWLAMDIELNAQGMAVWLDRPTA